MKNKGIPRKHYDIKTKRQAKKEAQGKKTNKAQEEQDK